MSSDDRRDDNDPLRIDPEDLDGADRAPGEPPPPPSAAVDDRCAVRTAIAADRGRHCPYAGVNFEPGERLAVCRNCAAVHLEQSWIENGGCTTYGCTYAPDFRKDAMVIETGAAPPMPPLPREAPAAPPTVAGSVPTAVGPVPQTGIVVPILLTIFCCQLTGVISLVYALKANTFRLEARWDDARSARKTAFIWMWISLVYIPIIILFAMLMIAADEM